MNEIENFLTTVKKVGGSLTIIIPHEHCQYSGIQEGNDIKIWYKKLKPKK